MTAKPKAAPRAPAGLDKSGIALWRRMHAAYAITARWELDLLELGCRQADDIAQLEEAVRDHGVMVEGSQGQPRLNPAAVEVRLSRAALARILGALELPSGAVVPKPAAGAGPATAAARRARKAADKRWANVAHLAPAKEG